ncbi:MAG: hypothetical protein A2Y34_15120 [Spirochaetes bacterium GWC1_27_15]|nr:MAG: hypothetical protein A2Y34_15120 [Spirochaetes bacterium GWC1_27_15]
MQGFFNYLLPVSLPYYKKSDENPCIFQKRKKVCLWRFLMTYSVAPNYLQKSFDLYEILKYNIFKKFLYTEMF